MNKLLLTDPLPDLFLSLIEGRFELAPLAASGDSEFARAVAIVAYGHPMIDDKLLERCPQVRVISNHGVGVDHIELKAAKKRGIPVGNTPGCLDASTADMTMALLLAAARNVVVGDRFARSSKFTEYDPSLLIGQEVTGSTLGIVGMGRIGAEVAKRARAFEMRVLYYNRNRRPEMEEAWGVEFASLDELLCTSDFISLNCPLTDETKGMIGRKQFESMKKTAILLNIARGAVVQTADLYEALAGHQIAAAGLDVTDPEPLPRDHPLLQLDNLVITPHLGSASNRTRQRMMEMTVENLQAGIVGDELPYRVA